MGQAEGSVQWALRQTFSLHQSVGRRSDGGQKSLLQISTTQKDHASVLTEAMKHTVYIKKSQFLVREKEGSKRSYNEEGIKYPAWEFLLHLAASGEVFEQDVEQFGTPSQESAGAPLFAQVCGEVWQVGDITGA